MSIPFRADQVGSLLRPAELAATRARFKRGEVDAAALKAAEDQAITEAVRRQEAIGLQSITDGEFRRDWWHLDFLAQLDGVSLQREPGPEVPDRRSGRAAADRHRHRPHRLQPADHGRALRLPEDRRPGARRR